MKHTVAKPGNFFIFIYNIGTVDTKKKKKIFAVVKKWKQVNKRYIKNLNLRGIVHGIPADR